MAFRVALTTMMVENVDSKLMDVETAFLYRELDEEIHMEVPVGINDFYQNSIDEEATCFLLKKGIYGLCQAARQFGRNLFKK